MAPSATTTTTATQTLSSTVMPSINNLTTGKKVRNLPTYEDIRSAIPKRCFEKSLFTSIFYFAFDYAIITALYFAVPYVEYYGGWAGLFAWYWIMGMFMSSLFIVGHDCGHGTFSNYTWVNDIFGHLSHGALMAPYWPWQKSHRQHHQYTSHLEKDKGHPWITESYYNSLDWLKRHFHSIPFSALIEWNPFYTIIGIPDGSHFWPYSRLFVNNFERLQCVFSCAVCALFSYAVYVYCGYSFLAFFKYYYVPIAFQGFWLTMFTYLQHQDEETEVYEDGTWNFVTGQMQTIDLFYGFGVDTLLHHITDGHVTHHLFFTKIPHYHLRAATRAVRGVLEKYPGAYKSRSCYAYVYEFFRLNIKLKYLIGEGSGILRYAVKINQHQNTAKENNSVILQNFISSEKIAKSKDE